MLLGRIVDMAVGYSHGLQVASKGKGKGQKAGVPPPPPPLVVPRTAKGASSIPAGYGSHPTANSTAFSGLTSVKLKPTETRVRHRDGTVSLEMRSDAGFECRSLEIEAEVPQYVKDQESGISRLEPKTFDETSNRWQSDKVWKEMQVEPRSQENLHLLNKGSLRLVTYNVWFSTQRQSARAAALFSILRDSEADVICLQEVTPIFLNLLRDESWVRSNYALSDSIGTTLKGSELVYGVVMLWKRELLVASLVLYALPTTMNRSALVASFRILHHELRVVTVHLESLDNVKIRSNQLERIFQLVGASSDLSIDAGAAANQSYGGAILTGDMNFDEGAEEDRIPARAGFSDCWQEVKHSWTEADVADQGITMPADDHTGKPTRIDRIFLGPSLENAAPWKLFPQSVRRLGMESIGEDPDSTPTGARPKYDWPYNRPSDHFGLCCDLHFCASSGASTAPNS